VVTLSSSDTEEALELLSLSLDHGVSSQPWGDIGSDLFKDWPKANDMVGSIYVALTAESSSSQAPIANAPHNERKPHVGVPRLNGLTLKHPCHGDPIVRNPKSLKHRVGNQNRLRRL
jgi:hypothetical protein